MVKSILLVVLSIFATSATNVPKSEAGLSIDSELQLAHYLKALLGQNSASSSQELKEYIAANDLSVLTAVESIALILTDAQSDDDSTNFDVSSKFAKYLGASLEKIDIHDLTGKSEQEVNQYIEDQLEGMEFKRIHGNGQEMQKMHKMLVKHQSRLLQEDSAESNDESFSYITKFFFILIFLIVSLGSLASIAYMENRKDTLLYAKFIADVGR